MPIPDIAVWIAGFVALIGLLQLATAVQQWRTANNRAVLDLFQRRFEVYNDCREVVRSVSGSGRADTATWIKVADATERARFLFGRDVVAKLEKLTSDLTDLETRVSEEEGLGPHERLENRKAQRIAKTSIFKFREEAPEIFAPYMRFEQRVHPGVLKQAWRWTAGA